LARKRGEDRVATYAPAGKPPEIIEAFEKGKEASSKGETMGASLSYRHRTAAPRQPLPIHTVAPLTPD